MRAPVSGNRVPLSGAAAILERWFEGARRPTEAAAAVARRLESHTGHALLAWDIDLLHEKAREAEERIAAGAGRPLEGLPVALKDNIALSGFPVSAGTQAAIARPAGDAAITEAIISAGAIPYAKANMTELALRGHGRNSHFGDVEAPGAPGYLAGGSSSGSAAAVKLGLAAFAVGTDTAGSVRMPAAACGVTGFKPAHGAVSLDGVVPLSQTCDHIGFLTRRVDELQTVLEGLSLVPRHSLSAHGEGPAAGDSAGSGSPGVKTPLRLLVPGAEAIRPLDPGQHQAFERVCRLLGAEPAPAGVTGPDFFDEAAQLYHHIRAFEAFRNFGEAVMTGTGFEPETVRAFAGFASVTEDQYRAALKRRAELRARLIAALAGNAILLLPTMSILAPPAAASEVTLEGVTLPLHAAMIRLPLPFSLLGVPALAVPAGAAGGGLSASVQLVCAPGDEAALFATAKRFEVLSGP